MQNDAFDSPRLLIQEAREGIADLELRVETFLREQQRGGGTEIDPKTGDQLLYVEFATDVPPKISLVVRAIARDLRDALDHAVFASAVALKGGSPKKTKFLIADTEQGILDDIRRGKCADVDPEIVAVMQQIGAHKAGNVSLWSLNQFRNDNTHKTVSISAASSAGLGIIQGSFDLFEADRMNEWRPTRRRLYFARCTARSKFNIQVDPMVQISLNKTLSVDRVSAVVGLTKLADMVEHVVFTIEAESERILRERGV